MPLFHVFGVNALCPSTDDAMPMVRRTGCILFAHDLPQAFSLAVQQPVIGEAPDIFGAVRAPKRDGLVIRADERLIVDELLVQYTHWRTTQDVYLPYRMTRNGLETQVTRLLAARASRRCQAAA